MITQGYIKSILAAALIVGGTGVALATPSKGCAMTPVVKQQIAHLPKQQQKTVSNQYRTTCIKSQKLKHVIHAKRAMLNAELLQPKINKAKIKQLVNQISRMQKERLELITNADLQMAKNTAVRPGLKYGSHLQRGHHTPQKSKH